MKSRIFEEQGTVQKGKNAIVRIKSRSLRKFLLKNYDNDGDGKLSVNDLEQVERLEISTPELQLWDEAPELSLVTHGFIHASDLKKLPKLMCLVVSGQPVFSATLPQRTLMEVIFVHCPLIRIKIRGANVNRNHDTNAIYWIAPDHPNYHKDCDSRGLNVPPEANEQVRVV